MMSDIIVISLGPGDPDLLNMKTLRTIREAKQLVLRTGRHPLVPWLEENLITFSTLDSLYDQSDDFDTLNRAVCDHLIRLAASGPVVYAVPDAVTPALSFLQDAAVTSVPADELSGGFHYDPNTSLLVTELDNPIQSGDVKLFLSDLLGDEHPVCLLQEGKPPVSIPLFELDRQSGIDHRSAVLIPASGLLDRKRFAFSDLENLMETLRSPSGCPWDRLQTHESLRPYMVEEAWECVASIDQQDPEHLCEELGDLLFQVIFHSSVGRSYGEFTINDVISAICTKMIHRHPHVFGDRDLRDPDSVRAVWEQLKQEETGNTSVLSSLDDVSTGLPSLKYAAKVMKKLKGTAAVRSDPAPVIADIIETASSLRSETVDDGGEQLSRLLYLVAELCFIRGIDSELILHQAVDRLKTRLKIVEKAVKQDGKSLEHLTFDELGVYLNHVEGEIE